MNAAIQKDASAPFAAAGLQLFTQFAVLLAEAFELGLDFLRPAARFFWPAFRLLTVDLMLKLLRLALDGFRGVMETGGAQVSHSGPHVFELARQIAHVRPVTAGWTWTFGTMTGFKAGAQFRCFALHGFGLFPATGFTCGGDLTVQVVQAFAQCVRFLHAALPGLALTAGGGFFAEAALGGFACTFAQFTPLRFGSLGALPGGAAFRAGAGLAALGGTGCQHKGGGEAAKQDGTMEAGQGGSFHG